MRKLLRILRQWWTALDARSVINPAMEVGLYKRIGNIHAVQKWLGHMKPETTARYIVGGDDDQLLAAARATHAFHVTRTEATAAAA